MKKAFDENVSRAKPRLRLGSLLTEASVVVTAAAEPVTASAVNAIKAAPAPSTEAAVALGTEVQARAERARSPKRSAVSAIAEALKVPVETVTEKVSGKNGAAATPEVRRERLRERLKAVRENPRPEPLPATAAEAGQRAVERIATLQAELTQVRALNLALTQDL
ncbi:MAG: extensin-like protein, partial [Myxococcaceae bacterium]